MLSYCLSLFSLSHTVSHCPLLSPSVPYCILLTPAGSCQFLLSPAVSHYLSYLLLSPTDPSQSSTAYSNRFLLSPLSLTGSRCLPLTHIIFYCLLLTSLALAGSICLLLFPVVSHCFLDFCRLLRLLLNPIGTCYILLSSAVSYCLLLYLTISRCVPLCPSVFCCILPCLMLYSPVSSYIAQSLAVSYCVLLYPIVSSYILFLLLYPTASCCILPSSA
jgi:hypothetical protein